MFKYSYSRFIFDFFYWHIQMCVYCEQNLVQKKECRSWYGCFSKKGNFILDWTLHLYVNGHVFWRTFARIFGSVYTISMLNFYLFEVKWIFVFLWGVFEYLFHWNNKYTCCLCRLLCIFLLLQHRRCKVVVLKCKFPFTDFNEKFYFKGHVYTKQMLLFSLGYGLVQFSYRSRADDRRY